MLTRPLRSFAHYDLLQTMSHSCPLEEKIAAGVRTLEADPHFASRTLWLTFHLTGGPTRLCEVADELSAKGWRNTDGWEGAFLYPKIEVDRSTNAIIQMAEFVIALCSSRDVEVINIDADTSPDVTQSKFIELYAA